MAKKMKMKYNDKYKKMANGGSTGGFPKTSRYGSTEHKGTSYKHGGKYDKYDK